MLLGLWSEDLNKPLGHQGPHLLRQNNHFREIYFLQKIFEQFDQDDSGGVDTYELGKLFAALG